MGFGADELVLEGGLDGVPRSRTFTRGALGSHLQALADDAALVVTELVTNALLHGGPPVRLRLREVEHGVRLEVTDRGAELPVAVRRSTVAMTGRGLALVEALTRSWGVDDDERGGKVVWAELGVGGEQRGEAAAPDQHAERLLDAFPDQDDVEPLHTVALGAVPTDLLLDAKAHIDNLVREFTLEAAAADETAAAGGRTVPPELGRLVATVVDGFRAARTAIKRQALEAAQRGEPEVHLTLTLPASAAEAGERYLAALDEADEWAAGARLLTLETPPVHKVFRHWYVQALVDQLRALADGTAPPPVVPFPQRLAAALSAPATPVARRTPLAPGIDHAALFRALPTPYMVMDRDLVLVECNDAYLATVGRSREDIVGRPVFEVFPPTPDALDEAGVPRIQRSFERARDTGQIDTMPLQRYDIPDPRTGGLITRFWSLISVPVRDSQGRVVLVAQRAEDISDFVAERDRGQAERQRTAELGRRVLEVEADLFARAQELAAAVADKERAAERVAALAQVALDLTRSDDVRDLTSTVIERGLPVLGADGGAVAVHGDDGLRLVASRSLGEQVQAAYGRLPLDSALPAAVVARTGQTVLLPTRAAGLAWSPDMAAVYEATSRSAWATLPLRVGSELLGSLVACWEQERQFADEDVALLEGFAAQVSQAVLRIRATEAQRAAALSVQRLSETLQLSLLTDPPHVPGLQIAVRYQPAAQEAQIGGDWYDAFVTATGSTLVVIGDIGGHDRTAAARMGQVRNLLRGMAYDSDDSPAVLLGRLDTAMQGLGLDTLATALLARVEPTDDGYRLRWANAGHLPPVLRTGTGRLHVLDDESDLLLGLDADAERRERTTDLPTGSSLVLYTDGLIERRDASLDAGIARVTQAVSRLGDADAEATADAVVTAAGSSNEDDIAVLVLRVRPDA